MHSKGPPAKAGPNSALKNEGTQHHGKSLGAFAVVLGAQLLLLGFFYTMASEYPAEARHRTLKPVFNAEPAEETTPVF